MYMMEACWQFVSVVEETVMVLIAGRGVLRCGNTVCKEHSANNIVRDGPEQSIPPRQATASNQTVCSNTHDE